MNQIKWGDILKKVLIADDALFMRDALKMILNRNGFQVVGEAGDGKEAVEKFKLLKPDIVTMDIHMPEMGGIEAIEQILKEDENANIIVISAAGDKVHIIDAITCGARNFIIKPFTEDRVIDVLKEI